MEFYQEILIHLLKQGKVDVVIHPHFDLSSAFDNECYRALAQIRGIVQDDTLDDPECFFKIEEIVNTFEDIGSGGGGRHDF